VVGDLRSAAEVRTVAEQVNALGPMDAVIHNAGVYASSTAMQQCNAAANRRRAESREVLPPRGGRHCKLRNDQPLGVLTDA
jgi:NAD(P)-dependent dehydrogenase (short-subunit alcohol dehydrogenase family)